MDITNLTPDQLHDLNVTLWRDDFALALDLCAESGTCEQDDPQYGWFSHECIEQCAEWLMS